MSYQVLARKWRPRDFQSLIGQEHVSRVLIHALEQNRLHHAYLFTGTRGVGKTTVARILAKCLNCETGITATPCNKCDACLSIDSGRFVDLIEVDAASRTKVEDTRELLNNVQYSPTRGRFKIYLIDEVHMLSGHSFNALLKTLEEPPEHVKFLLATTDPQKLPITVLSRCLQFYLKNLSTEQISKHLQHVLTEEKIKFDLPATTQLAHGANGSMRDALSLLDQAISFGHGTIQNSDVSQMLGAIDQHEMQFILEALARKDGKELLEISARLAEYSADYNNVLESLLTWLHAIAMTQMIPGIGTLLHEEHADLIETFSKQLSPDDIQLYYQIALIGRRDLNLAPDARIGFEMILLRLLSFDPIATSTTPTQQSMPVKKPAAPVKNTETKTAASTDHWGTLLNDLSLTGMARSLALNCAFKHFENDTMELTLDPSHAALLNEKLKIRLNQALNDHFKKTIHLSITIAKPDVETPAHLQQRKTDERHQSAVEEIQQNPTVRALVNKLGAKVTPELVKPSSE